MFFNKPVTNKFHIPCPWNGKTESCLSEHFRVGMKWVLAIRWSIHQLLGADKHTEAQKLNLFRQSALSSSSV
jgi:hypothetical protein